MFQSVTADKVSGMENGFVEEFEKLRENVETCDDCQVGSAAVACWEEQHDQQHKSGIYLDCRVEAQIADAMKFGFVP